MRGPQAWVGVAVLLWVFPPVAGAFGQDAVPPAAAETPSLAWLGIKGEAIFKSYTYFDEAPADDRLYREEGIFRLEWSRQFAPWVGVKLVGEVRGDTDGDANGVYELRRKPVQIAGEAWRVDEVEMQDMQNGTKTIVYVERRRSLLHRSAEAP